MKHLLLLSRHLIKTSAPLDLAGQTLKSLTNVRNVKAPINQAAQQFKPTTTRVPQTSASLVPNPVDQLTPGGINAY